MNAINMNRISLSLRPLRQAAITLLTGVLLLMGCTDKIDLPYPNQEGVPNSMVRFTITPNLAPSDAVATRATTPSVADTEFGGPIRVLVFDGNGPDAVLKQDPAVGNYDGVTGKITALLTQETAEDRYLCILANLSSDDVTYISTLVRNTTKLSDITPYLRFSLPASAPIRIGFPLVMYGWSGPQKIDPSGAALSVSFARSVARIDIDGSAAEFIIGGALMSSAPRYGYTLPQSNLPLFGVTELSTYDEVPNDPLTPKESMIDQLFCFESKGNIDGFNDRSTRVIIKGTPKGSSTASYYPIDIIYNDPTDPNPTPKKLADIRRNTIYTINLKSVMKDGYRTVEEAARSAAFNSQLEMDIIVTDPYAHDITTNGKQYLGVTNSEFVVYPLDNNSVTNVHVTTVSYTCDPGWSVGSIELPTDRNGARMTFATTGGQTARLEVSSSVVLQDILVNIPPLFTSGNIILHIGNLRKEITVRRMTPTPPTGGVFSDYFNAPNTLNDYRVGEIIAPTAATSWLKVSRTAALGLGASSLDDQVVNPEGGIYIHAEPNVGFNTNLVAREASLYVSGVQDNQRIKVLIQQNFFDVYGNINQIPQTYVGTFHRWNETAERLIRISIPTSSITRQAADIWWQADVVAGREFIILDTEEGANDGTMSGTKTWSSPDNVNHLGVGDAPSGLYANSQTLEQVTKAQLDSRLRSIRKEGTRSIYFRVGMTGKLAGPEAQPRYGLIVITAGIKGAAATIRHNIYVRQGEAADYLMRPWDPSTKRPDKSFDFNSATRPMARRIAPYNSTYIGISTADVVNEGTNGYGFVEYPSQGGYYFLSSGTQAIKSTATSFSGLSAPSYAAPDLWNPAWETCPKGYRRPNDGAPRPYADEWYTSSGANDPGGANPRYKDDIVNSEIRQSIWLYPLHGGFKSDFSNQLRGFLADGYFDRRAITQSDNFPPDARDNAIVSANQLNAAYRGYLVFNPINYASIFLPLGGAYLAWAGQIRGKGNSGIFHSATAGSGVNDGWTLQLMYNSTGWGTEGWVFDMYAKSTSKEGHSVRCIKDDQPLVGTETGENTTIDGINTSNASQLAIRHLYVAGGTLQSQIEAQYTADQLLRINSIAISGNSILSDADYAYLNTWANGTSYTGSILRHLILRGKANASIPTGAFTSNRWSHIILYDANALATRAFDGVAGLNNLTFGQLDNITPASDAFKFTTSRVQLHLEKSGSEYKTQVSGNTWKGSSWAAIKGE